MSRQSDEQLQRVEAAPTPAPIASAQTQIDALRRIAEQKTPEAAIRWRKGRGGQQMPYTDVAFVIRELNQAFGFDWDFVADHEELIFNGETPFEVKVRGTLTVRLGRRAVVKTQFGSMPIEFLRDGTAPVSIGDCYKGASSDALKKCASLLGIALDLYDSDSDVHGGSGNAGNGESGRNFDPKPKTLGDLVTPKQLWMIRNTARELGIDAEEYCKKRFEIGLEEISKRAASILIEYLKGAMVTPAEAPAASSPQASAPKAEQKTESKPRPKGMAGQILALADALKWTEQQLEAELYTQFEISVTPGQIIAALDSLSGAEQQKLVSALKAKLEARTQPTNQQTNRRTA